MELKEWLSSGKKIHVQGLEIFYQYQGNGPLLLLLHAYPTASWGWHKMWHHLTRNFTIIAPDLPGSGFSDKPLNYTYSIPKLASITQSLLSEISHEPVHILAHAYGCSVAQALIQNHTKGELTLQSAYFINGGIFPEHAHTTLMQRFLTSPLGSLLTSIIPTPRNAFIRNFKKTFSQKHLPTDREMLEYWLLLQTNNGHKSVPKVIQYIRERKHLRDTWINAMQRANIPLGLFLAVEDPMIDPQLATTWKYYFPDSHCEQSLIDSGHYPPLEIPDTVWNAYYQFYMFHFG